ncbi:MAG: MFS transporter [Thaumarchaeota archaeon]|nr:MFS transporter [Nitrososphaerota archaeon]
MACIKKGGRKKVDCKRFLHQKSDSVPWLTILALGMGMLVYGIAESYGPVAAISSIIPSKFSYLGFGLPSIAGGVGSLFAGIITDRLGRRNSFLTVALMIIVGVVIFLAFPTSTAALIISFILIGMAAIGLETPIITAISEVVPAKWRGNVEVVVQNFGNLGVALIFIPALLGFTVAQTELAYGILFIAPLAAMLIGYWGVKETLPWKSIKDGSKEDVKKAWENVDKGHVESVKPTSPFWFRFLFITVIGIVQSVAFVWITYDVAYYYFASSVADIVPVIGGITMMIVGISFGIFFAHKFSRKSATTFSYGLLVALWAILWIYVALTKSSSGLLLLALMTLLFVPTELTWGTRAMLTPELFRTEQRGTYVSIVRTLVWIITGLITMVLSYIVLPFNVSSAIVMAIFIIGFAFTLAWQLKGFETAGKSLSGLDL